MTFSTFRRFCAIVVGMVGLTSCGGSVGSGGNGNGNGSTGTAVVTGTVKSQALNASDAVALDITQFNGVSNNGPTTVVMISDQAALCAQLPNGEPTGTILGLDIIQNSDSNVYVTPTPGTFYATPNVPAGVTKFANVSFTHSTVACMSTDVTPTGGTVQVDAIDLNVGGSVKGTFDLMFGTDHLTGSFNAAYCGNRVGLGSCSGNGGM